MLQASAGHCKQRANFALSVCFKAVRTTCPSVCTDYVSGGEMFTHLYQRDHFPEEAVRVYIGEIILALEHLHKVCTAESSPLLLDRVIGRPNQLHYEYKKPKMLSMDNIGS